MGRAAGWAAVCSAENRSAEMRKQYEEDFGFVVRRDGKGV